MSYRHYSAKEITQLQKKSVRDEEGVFLIEGKKILAEAVAAGYDVFQVLATQKFMREQRDFLQSIPQLRNMQITEIAEHTAERISTTKTPAGIFAILPKPEYSFDDIKQKQRIVILENVRDPGNLGTMIRTADWFGVEAVIVSDNGVDPFNDKVIRAAMGSLFHIPLYISLSLVDDIEELKKDGFTMVVTRPEGSSTSLPQKNQKVGFIFGNESLGTSPEIDRLADSSYAIPKLGKAESLNVAVSFGIVLYELTK